MMTMMPKEWFSRRPHPLLVATLSILVAGCNLSPTVSSSKPGGGGSGGSGEGGQGGTADASPLAPMGPPRAFPDGGSRADACQPAACAVGGGNYCGKIGDGCGGTLDCPACPMGETCGGGGTAQVCGKPVDPNCVPITCAQAGGRLCGRVGDGCGRALDCGNCPNGDTCGGAMANVCGGGSGAVCDNLCKQQMKCPGGGETIVTGTVFAPTPPRFGMADPLYNAVVYVPNAPVAPFAPGVACEQCGKISGSPLVTALTGPDGKFTLRNVPVGTDIPLVIQIGRWRRQVKIPSVAACTTTALPAELTRLPRNKAEGDIPAIAIATGSWDPFDCTLRKIGVDEAEFTLPTGNGRVHMWAFGGNTLGANTPDGDQLTGSLATMSKYDIVLLPCDSEDDKPAAEMRNLVDYTGKGGRVFLTDWSYSWLKDEPMGPFHRTVTWKQQVVYQGTDYEALLDQTFPKGMAFAEWLGVVRATAPMAGRIRIHDPYEGASNVDDVVVPSQRWMYTEGGMKSIQHLTFNTPIGSPPAQQCGRVVFSQFHVAESNGDPFSLVTTFPRACDNSPMSPQEKALEFMLFDASACIQPDTERPMVFQPPPPAPLPPPAPIP
jgi:hypothetical protein